MKELIEAQFVWQLTSMGLVGIIMVLFYIDKKVCCHFGWEKLERMRERGLISENQKMSRIKRKQYQLQKEGENLMKLILCVIVGMLLLVVVQSSGMTNPVQRFTDLEERHEALVDFWNLEENLIPRHWTINFKK